MTSPERGPEGGFDRAELEEAGRRAADLFVEIFAELESRRVAPAEGRAVLRERFHRTLGEDGVGLRRVLEEFAERVLTSSMGTPHPLYLGLVNTSPLPAAALADLLVSSLNNNGGAFHQSPAMTAAEAEVLRAFRELFGLPKHASGLLLPGGSFANLHGLLLARARHFPEWERSGPRAVARRPVVYASEAAHFSVGRAARAVGLGRDGVAPVSGDGRGAMDAGALAARVRSDRKAGAAPFAVVATAGTTGTGAIDPLAELRAVCDAEGLWLHVDACYGGGALLLDELRPRFRGIETADSLAVDPHKWFFMPLTAAIAFSRHPDLEESAFGIDASYIPGDGTPDAYRRGLPTSRRSSGLTVWMALRAHGFGTVRAAVRRNIELTRRLEALMAERGFHVLPGGELSVACARWQPPGLGERETDELQDEIRRRVVASGKAWFSTVRHAGRTWLRFNSVNLYVRARHMEALVAELTRAATETSARPGPGHRRTS